MKKGVDANTLSALQEVDEDEDEESGSEEEKKE